MPINPDPSTTIATYRVQMHGKFGFARVAALADYLAQLGVSHLYASPCLQATAGSSHGYDVVNTSCCNCELGTEDDLRSLSQTLRSVGMYQLLDIVPNHMGTGAANTWWWDVLRSGPCSPYAAFFDIDWEAPEARLHGKVLLPILGQSFGKAVEAREIQLERQTTAPGQVDFVIRYFDDTFPASAESLAEPLRRAAVRTRSETLSFLADACQQLYEENSSKTRCRDSRVLLLQAAKLYDHPATAKALDDAIAAINRDPDALEQVLRRQHYRLAWWRTAARELNYRRFFDVNTLIGVRAEDDRVFHATHQLVLQWLREGVIHGLRIDHPDGLRDPQAYLERLRHAVPRHTWIVVEKILERGETLPETWPVQGTTGYDFMNMVTGLFVDPAGEPNMSEAYSRLTGEYAPYEQVLRDAKAHVLSKSFGGELNRLTAIALEIIEARRVYRDFTRHELHEAIRALVIAMPVYRTYVRPDLWAVSDADKRDVMLAVDAARSLRPDVHPDLLEFLRDVLLLKSRGVKEDEFVYRFQQLTGPVMAKGAEDTAFYRYHRLVCLNEVGGDPGHFGVTPPQFYDWCSYIQRRWPLTLLATSTHDTKRSEDVRARLALLSEIPVEWSDCVSKWMGLAAKYRTPKWPDRNSEYLLYQTLVGAWPIELDRIKQYMTKAIREAKVYTGWTDSDADYETAVMRFVEQVMNDDEIRRDIEKFVARLIEPGRINSLSMTAIKLTAPGVPDIYQGCELWDLSLVDPDNRRDVDFNRRRELAARVAGMTAEQAWAEADSGAPKIFLIGRVLAMRRRHVTAFGPDSSFTPLPLTGSKTDHVAAFTRGGAVATIVPRLLFKLASKWEDTAVTLPAGRWRHVLTEDTLDGGVVQVSTLVQRFPVAVLVKEDRR